MSSITQTSNQVVWQHKDGKVTVTYNNSGNPTLKCEGVTFNNLREALLGMPGKQKSLFMRTCRAAKNEAAKNTPAPSTTTPAAPKPSPKSDTTTTTSSPVINPLVISGDYTDGDITKGFYNAHNRFFVKESLDKASFKIGDQVQFADGSTRIIKDVQAHGPNVHYFYEGKHLDPAEVAGEAMQKIAS